MVCYSMHRTEPKVTIEKINEKLAIMVLEFEYSEPVQEDGHMRWHGDDVRSLAESIIYNMSREVIANALKEAGINALYTDGSGAKVKTTDRFSEWRMPIYEVEIRVRIIIEEDIHKSLANHIVDHIKWKPMKEAMLNKDNKHYSCSGISNECCDD